LTNGADVPELALSQSSLLSLSCYCGGTSP